METHRNRIKNQRSYSNILEIALVKGSTDQRVNRSASLSSPRLIGKISPTSVSADRGGGSAPAEVFAAAEEDTLRPLPAEHCIGHRARIAMQVRILVLTPPDVKRSRHVQCRSFKLKKSFELEFARFCTVAQDLLGSSEQQIVRGGRTDPRSTLVMFDLPVGRMLV